MSAHGRFRCPIAAIAAFAALSMAACRKDMADQPRSKPFRQNDYFADGAGSRPLPANTIARGQLELNPAISSGKHNGQLITELPVPLDRQLIQRGQQRYDIFCSVCHGRTGDGLGMIVQRGFPPPPSFHIERLQQAPIGHFFDVITNGYGLMYPYATRVPPRDRWAIAAYIRVLQQSQQARFADLSEADRKSLEAVPE